jgi:hypothetical protein
MMVRSGSGFLQIMTDADLDPGGPKTYGYPTLLILQVFKNICNKKVKIGQFCVKLDFSWTGNFFFKYGSNLNGYIIVPSTFMLYFQTFADF